VPGATAPERATRALPTGLVVRPAADADIAGIQQLVWDVMSEVYGDLFPGGPPPPVGQWQCGLVAEQGGRIVGVVVADDDWVEDLWVASGHRGCGIGSVLLAAAERQISERGHGEARLRVVAENARARDFYGARGWTESVFHPHEKWDFAMLEMRKKLAA
jgi:GNAT superfamily N-acetyltransferase